MGYELHITRARDWVESIEHPISVEEWNDVARGHPALREHGVIHWSDIGAQPVFSITGDDGRGASLTWRHARITVKGDYGDAVQETVLALAEELQAMLVGDEGERYLTDGRCEVLPPRAEAQQPAPKRRHRWFRGRSSH